MLKTCVLLVSVLGWGAAVAQGPPDRDTREVLGLALTEPGLARYAEASRNLVPLLERMPVDCNGEEGPRSLDQLGARLDASPEVKAAIGSAGMTSRDYVLFTWSLLVHGIAAWGLDQPGGKLPPGMSKANVDFVKKHQPEIEKLEALKKFGDCDSGSEDD